MLKPHVVVQTITVLWEVGVVVVDLATAFAAIVIMVAIGHGGQKCGARWHQR